VRVIVNGIQLLLWVWCIGLEGKEYLVVASSFAQDYSPGDKLNIYLKHLQKNRISMLYKSYGHYVE
jgi:hypothetical protein